MIGFRLLSGVVYYNYYTLKSFNFYETMFKFLNLAVYWLYVLEYASLLLLTSISSKENHFVHQSSTIAFLIFSSLHTLLVTLYLAPRSFIFRGSTSLKWKQYSAVVNVTSVFLCSYLYYRHNSYCEPYVFSIFAFFEWAVVFSNITFHCSEIWDFQGGELLFLLRPPLESAKDV
jgi:hypothetical protein